MEYSEGTTFYNLPDPFAQSLPPVHDPINKYQYLPSPQKVIRQPPPIFDKYQYLPDPAPPSPFIDPKPHYGQTFIAPSYHPFYFTSPETIDVPTGSQLYNVSTAHPFEQSYFSSTPSCESGVSVGSDQSSHCDLEGWAASSDSGLSSSEEPAEEPIEPPDYTW